MNDATSGALWHDAVALDDIRSPLLENALQAADGETSAAAGPYATALAEQLRAARGLSASEFLTG